MIYDAFIYFQEEELLKLRLEELKDVVDYHVIIESTHTFRGEPKPSNLDPVIKKMGRETHKITWYYAPMPQEFTDPWEREAWQRNQIKYLVSCITPTVADDDIIIVSDADEIPRPSSIQALELEDKPVYFDVDQYFWNCNWLVPPHCNLGGRPFAVKYKYLEPHAQRVSHDGILLPNAGWHFSYYGSYEKNKMKIESFAHSEYDKDEYKSAKHIQHCIEQGLDPFGRYPLKWYDVGETHPETLQRRYMCTT